ncbi:ATP-grasp domain-containing protein [Bacillus spizizenii]|uniref:ATP-grasp domain-containing protein n=1 Tax=Bacillus spizizenii TaxID=96241 RepID=UPI00227F0071|nr:ATP-grasp domain-containing protein [Bacillus spizizenii]MCY7886617.1 ATP-grasp domain-containing protein [Bacillus spizizenii]MCY7997791.1 ATP-grasp domain-containing protein [Bacillus spizizenii]MCY8062612.1 ATP-grasp domain-containing protein [Bacillus spizizenii]MCY8111729.1 ATP-grasp domain-containing protein [Bacillus spizizenii]MCY8335245.1 ATP-grasp domain-containing protein [Bacillus spizizenii]
MHECKNYDQIESFDEYPVNGCIEIRALELHETYSFNTIIAMSEYDLLRAGKLRTHLGLKGQSYESALLFRDKVLMKQRLEEQGIPVPHYRKIESPVDLYLFVQQFGFPVVVKPIDGSGSVDTKVLKNEKDMMKYLSKGLDGNVEVETFVDGDMYHIDGLMIDGHITLNWPSRYINGCLAFQEEQFLASYQLGADNPLTSRLIGIVEKALKALPSPKTTTFHAEVFHTPDDKLVFCEIASRTGGGLIREAIQQGFGFDLNEVCVKKQCGLPYDIPDYSQLKIGPKQLGGWILIPPKYGRLVKIPSIPFENWVTKQKVSAREGEVFQGASSSVDVVSSYLIKGNSEDVLINRIHQVASWCSENMIWEGKSTCSLK